MSGMRSLGVIERRKPANRVLPVTTTFKYLATDVCFGNVEVSALLDTACSYSLMSVGFFNANILGTKCMKGQETECFRASTASNQEIESSQKVFVHFKIKPYSWTFPFFVVKDLPFQVILGIDFMQFANITLNIQNSTFSFSFGKNLVFPLIEDICRQTSVKSVEINNSISPEQRHKFEKLIDEYGDVITKRLGRTTMVEYEIEVTDDVPVRSRPYAYAPPKMELMRKHIKELLDQDVIRPSTSNYSSPAFLVNKKDGGSRLVCDFKALNKKIKIDTAVLPTIEEAFQYLGKAKYFTIIDLNSSYHQIPLKESSKKFVAFVCPVGTFEYQVLPMGLATSSQKLTSFLDTLLGDIKYKFIFSYVDDILVFSESLSAHYEHLAEVLKRLRKAGLTVKPTKMSVAQQRVEFLGHVFENHQISINKDRIKPIVEYPRPKTVKQVSRFLGMAAFYSRYIPNFSAVAAPLNKLKKKNVQFVWTVEQQQAFDTLKRVLSSSQVLRMPDFDLPFVLTTDACATGLGAVLSQEVEGGLAPVAFASRTTTEHERKASSFELEAAAVVFGLDKFRQYLEHREFTIFCDNTAVTWLMNHPRHVSGKFARWVEKINSFKFTIRHIKGSENVVADCLSRLFEEEAGNPVVRNKATPSSSDTTSLTERGHANILVSVPDAFVDIRTHQRNDPTLNEIYDRLRRNGAQKGYKIVNKTLMFVANPNTRPKVVVPEKLVPAILKYYHESPNSTHGGIKQTMDRVKKSFYWPTLNSDVRKFVKTCHLCQLSKQAQNSKVGFLSSVGPTRCMERVFIDYVGPLPRSSSGNKYILTVVDGFSKFVTLIPTRNATAETTTRVLKSRVIGYFGCPEVVVTDNGAPFNSEKFRSMCFALGITHKNTIVHYPNPSQAERVNKNLKVALRIYHSQDHSKWDVNIPYFTMSWNSATHGSTGESPSMLFFGREMNQPLELRWDINKLAGIEPLSGPQLKAAWEAAVAQLKKARTNSAAQYNKGRIDNYFKEGDLVVYRRVNRSSAAEKVTQKLLPKWSEPLEIYSFPSPVSVDLVDPKTGRHVRRAHLSQLKPYHPREIEPGGSAGRERGTHNVK